MEGCLDRRVGRMNGRKVGEWMDGRMASLLDGPSIWRYWFCSRTDVRVLELVGLEPKNKNK